MINQILKYIKDAMLRFDKLLNMQIYKYIYLFLMSFILLSLYYLVASLAFVYLIIFLTLLFRFFFVVPSLFVYFFAFNSYLPSVFFFFCVFSYLCLCINRSLYSYFALFSS